MRSLFFYFLLAISFSASCQKAEVKATLISIGNYTEPIDTTPPAPTTDTLYLYVSAGQSNMAGRAVDSFPYANAQMQVSGVKVFVYNNPTYPEIHNTFQTFEYDRYNGSDAQNNPRFAGDIIVVKKIRDSIYAGSNNVYLMKATTGGTSLAPSTSSTGSWCYPQDSVPAGKHRMLDTLENRLNRVRALYPDKYVKVVCIMWHQGEDDQTATASQNAYYFRLKRTFARIRELCGNDSIPIVMGTVPTASNHYSSIINAAQHAVADEQEHTYIVDLSNAALKSDNVHLNGAGQWYFGNEMYKIIKNFAQ